MNRKLEDGNSKMEDANNSINVSEKNCRNFKWNEIRERWEGDLKRKVKQLKVAAKITSEKKDI